MKRSAASAAKGAAKPKKATNSHPLAKPLPEGLVLTDLAKAEWKVGKPIGSGGFGLLYLAQPNSSSSVADNAQYVIKVEPISNGPLFCELHFYQRAAKPDAIREWMSAQGLKSLGVPRFVAAGNHEYTKERYRFMVMERFGDDLQKLFERAGRQFPTHTVFLLGLKLIDILEYIHEKEYVHADIKASNLLLGHKDPQQVYLVDYGLAFRYTSDGVHKPYKEDPKRTHDGTVEFTSRDAHRGVVPSRRGDLEILGYCMLQWLCRYLPWEDKLDNKEYVRDQKIKYMSDIPGLMKKCFPGAENIPVSEVSAYLRYVAGLEYAEKPNYQQCRAFFTKALKSLGCKVTDKLEFGAATGDRTATATPKGAKKRALTPKVATPVASKPAAKRAPAKRRQISDDDDSEADEDFDGDERSSPSPPKIARRSSSLQSQRPTSTTTTPKTQNKKSPATARSAAASLSPAARARTPAAVRQATAKPAAARSAAALSPVARAVAAGRAVVERYEAMSTTPAAKKTRVVKKRQRKAMSTAATQTTPGLNGR